MHTGMARNARGNWDWIERDYLRSYCDIMGDLEVSYYHYNSVKAAYLRGL